MENQTFSDLCIHRSSEAGRDIEFGRSFLEFGRSFIEFGRSFIEFGRSFIEFGRSFIEFGRSFLEFGRSFLEFKQWLGWGKTQIIRPLAKVTFALLREKGKGQRGKVFYSFSLSPLPFPYKCP
ncbi:hypothetical protein [Nostoc sp. DSM 114159]